MSSFAADTAFHGIRLAIIAMMLVAAGACGGGGAAVEPTSGGTTPNSPAEQPSPTSPSAPPSGVIVTTPDDSFAPRVVSIAPGGSVTWQISGSTHNVTFAAAEPAGGDIPDTRSASVSRTFPAAGTYDYQCTRHSGMTGQVIVGGDGAPSPPAPSPSAGVLVQATGSDFNAERAEIAPGGTVTWEFTAGADGIVFEDEAPPGGNIPESPRGSRVSRTFPSEGDYDYTSLKNPDVDGRVRVR